MVCSMRGKVAVKDFRIERWPMGDLHPAKGSAAEPLAPSRGACVSAPPPRIEKKSSQPPTEKGPRSPKRVNGSLF